MDDSVLFNLRLAATITNEIKNNGVENCKGAMIVHPYVDALRIL